jgi:uncharacterized protein (DUF302 family)
MKKNLGLIILMMTMPFSILASEGLITVKSQYSVNETAERLIAILEDKGMKIFAVIDHQMGARSASIELPETKLIIFGNPKAGAPLMACKQSVAIDLPLKALLTADSEGAVWLSYNDPAFLKHRHAIKGCDKPLAKISKAVANIAFAATNKEK